ncbi:MAG: hypothetical protein CME65_12670 [Halobacteriovoraceae bacterium]|nr:hypothetical protein [Halobacteriovoraceae bacterium]|tara:strand:- start:13132 stop:13725 length:594 start_codon:yes stop_codon:yes gene_type:complete
MVKTVNEVFYANRLMDQEEYEAAKTELLSIYEYALSKGEPTMYICYRLAWCEYNLNQPEEGIGWLDHALINDPYNTLYSSLEYSLFDQLRSKIQMHIDLNPGPEGEVERLYHICFERGFVNSNLEFQMIEYYMKNNNFSAAKPFLDNALLRNPNDREIKAYRLHIAEIEQDKPTIKRLQKGQISHSLNRLNLKVVHQ